MKDEMNEREPEVDIEEIGEDNLDEPLIEDIETDSQLKIKKLQAKLKSCEAEKTQHLDNLQRAKAEFLNVRKRLEEEKLRDKERATTEHVLKLLPLCDSFHMAMMDQEAWNSTPAEWREGVESIQNQLQKILDSYNVSTLNPSGEEFDPTTHEAMSEVEVTKKSDDHKVISVIQNGYQRTVGNHVELIRPARVIVGILKR